MLKREEILKMFEAAGAIRHGHFELSSGLHSGTYVQCALVLQYPRFAEKLGRAMADLFSDVRVDAVVSPAMGGLIIEQEVARALPEPKGQAGGVPALFVERDASGMMTLRRDHGSHSRSRRGKRTRDRGRCVDRSKRQGN